MFDLGIDKMIVVAVLVGLIMGPERLRELRRALPRHIGRIHALYQQGRAQVVDELDELAPDWREYDPRALHPRRILKDIAAGTTVPATTSAVPGELPGEATAAPERGDEDALWTPPVDGPTTAGEGEQMSRKRAGSPPAETVPVPPAGPQPPVALPGPESD
ncbi:hypothetical protein RWH44_03015 [Microbacterium sp. KSW2-29]|uniref:Translocase n=1 Tax=Microbacterium phycohabitans TaxID=3075993 RepID=A0ABU3SJV8_9MICO|nr:hypothetical protein [Microbacterium sp. KSW2-29]MDU0344667.1 hypothetical protein [Microbacterium sp. KSW2-29]